ncbi:MAG: Crp/Fnr family transcriptional regulator [Egibacteraceae bacterium]
MTLTRVASGLAEQLTESRHWENGPSDSSQEQFEDGSFLASAPVEVVQEISKLGWHRLFHHGATLVTQGQTPHRILLLLRGRVKVAYRTDDGREVLFDVFGPGELIGAVSAIDGEPADATTTAIDDVEALVIDSAHFDRYLQADPDAARIFLRMLSRRLRKATKDRAALAMNDALGRICLRLVELADRYGELTDGRIRITLPLSQQELAAWTGTSREATSKALHTLRRRGCIETRRREIHILDITDLHQRVTGNARDLHLAMIL